MNVLFLTHNYPRHSRDYSGVFLHLLARQLKAEDVNVTVLAPHDAGLPESEVLDGIPVHRFRYATDAGETFAYRGNMHRQLLSPTGIFRFRKFLKAMKHRAVELTQDTPFDLIAAHWAIPAARVAAQVAAQMKLPLVVHSHGTDVRLLSTLLPARLFAGPALKQAKRWTVVSSYLRSVAQEAFPALRDKIEVCPLPNDETIFNPDETVGHLPTQIVSVTRFTEQKRVKTLIEACRILRDRNVKFQLNIFGSGPLKKAIDEKIKEYDLDDGSVQIYRPEFQGLLRNQYSLAQIVVLNSFKEGFGLTLVEGALCGALPVGVNSGGITDIIEHGRNGLLAEVDNAESLADVLQEALTNPEQTRRMAETARADAKERFTGPAVARRYAAVYRSAVG